MEKFSSYRLESDDDYAVKDGVIKSFPPSLPYRNHKKTTSNIWPLMNKESHWSHPWTSQGCFYVRYGIRLAIGEIRALKKDALRIFMWSSKVIQQWNYVRPRKHTESDACHWPQGQKKYLGLLRHRLVSIFLHSTESFPIMSEKWGRFGRRHVMKSESRSIRKCHQTFTRLPASWWRCWSWNGQRHLWTYFTDMTRNMLREHPGGCLRLLKNAVS